MGYSPEAMGPGRAPEAHSEAGPYETRIIDGEPAVCRRIDLLEEYGEAFESADSYRKIGTVKARQATSREEITTRQDGTVNFAEPGDWVIHNPGDADPYVFGDKTKKVEDEGGNLVEVPTTVAERQAAFEAKYVSQQGEAGTFIPKGVIRAVQVTQNLVFSTPWGEDMAVRAGGWVTDGGYSIAEKSFGSYVRVPETPVTGQGESA